MAFANAYRDYAKQRPGRYAASQFELDPQTAANSAAPRHAQMTRAISRGYDLPEPDQTDAMRLLGSTFHGFVSLEAAGGFRHTPRARPRPPGPGLWTPSASPSKTIRGNRHDRLDPRPSTRASCAARSR